MSDPRYRIEMEDVVFLKMARSIYEEVFTLFVSKGKEKAQSGAPVDGRTYYVQVEFEDGRGYITKRETCPYPYNVKSHETFPLGSSFTRGYGEKTEEDLIAGILIDLQDGNNSCDCNKRLHLAEAYGIDLSNEDEVCSDTIITTKITLIRPDLSREVIWEKAEE